MKKILLLFFIVISINATIIAQNKNIFLGGVNYYAIDIDRGWLTPADYFGKEYFSVPLIYVNYDRILAKRISVGLKFGEGYSSKCSNNDEILLTASTMIFDLNLSYIFINKKKFESSISLSPAIASMKFYGVDNNNFLKWGGTTASLKFDFNVKYKFKNNSFIGLNADYAKQYINRLVKLEPYSCGIFYGFSF